MPDAHALAAAVRDLPALHAKRDLRLVRALGSVGDGDDGALIAHGFCVPTVTGIHASTMAVNTASRLVMEKCGMELERHFVADWPVRIDGDELGEVEYAITREQWLAAGSGPPGT